MIDSPDTAGSHEYNHLVSELTIRCTAIAQKDRHSLSCHDPAFLLWDHLHCQNRCSNIFLHWHILTNHMGNPNTSLQSQSDLLIKPKVFYKCAELFKKGCIHIYWAEVRLLAGWYRTECLCRWFSSNFSLAVWLCSTYHPRGFSSGAVRSEAAPSSEVRAQAGALRPIQRAAGIWSTPKYP